MTPAKAKTGTGRIMNKDLEGICTNRKMTLKKELFGKSRISIMDLIRLRKRIWNFIKQ